MHTLIIDPPVHIVAFSFYVHTAPTSEALTASMSFEFEHSPEVTVSFSDFHSPFSKGQLHAVQYIIMQRTHCYVCIH